jgi:hypothetical protein
LDNRITAWRLAWTWKVTGVGEQDGKSRARNIAQNLTKPDSGARFND